MSDTARLSIFCRPELSWVVDTNLGLFLFRAEVGGVEEGWGGECFIKSGMKKRKLFEKKVLKDVFHLLVSRKEMTHVKQRGHCKEPPQ